jgi:hypothetical protein
LRIFDITEGGMLRSKLHSIASKFDEILDTASGKLGNDSAKGKAHKRDSILSKSNVLRNSQHSCIILELSSWLQILKTLSKLSFVMESGKP